MEIELEGAKGFKSDNCKAMPTERKNSVMRCDITGEIESIYEEGVEAGIVLVLRLISLIGR